jgi:hypothetical protein
VEERRTGHHLTLHDTRRFLIGSWNITGIISGKIRVVLHLTICCDGIVKTLGRIYLREPTAEIEARFVVVAK